MNANPVLLQKKYSRVIGQFAEKRGISLDEALEFFYHSEVYPLLRDGVSDMHCMSDGYLAEELVQEYCRRKKSMTTAQYLLSAEPQLAPVCRQLSAAVPDEARIAPVFDTQREILRQMVQPRAYVRSVRAAELPCRTDIPAEQELLVVLLTLGAEGEAHVQELFSENEHLQGLVADAMLNEWLFCADGELQERLREQCEAAGCGVKRRLEPARELPLELTDWICEQVDADVQISSGHMISPQKTMCYILELCQDSGRFEAAHDCSGCARTDCPLRRSAAVPEIRILVENLGKRLRAKAGSQLLCVLQENEIPIAADCGGMGHCGKCRIRLAGGELPESTADRQYLSVEERAMGMRLACTAYPTADIRIRVPLVRAQADIRAEEYRADAGGYGVAIDIGTTTLAAVLYGHTDGRHLAECTAANSGRSYGADVLSRMEASIAGNGTRLRELLQKDLRALLRRLCEAAGIALKDITSVTCAGNLTMVHLLMGYPCDTLGRAPFIPFFRGSLRMDAGDLLSDAECCAPVLILPAVSAFVGGDITAGMLALDMDRRHSPMLLLDIGTNGEMVLCAGEKRYVTSAAAGPAFEGGGISCGCAAVDGAVARVQLVTMPDHTVRTDVTTIAGAPACGICGSGVLTLVSELLRHGLLDRNGTLAEPYRERGYAFAESSAGTFYFTQADVRAVQLAKGAIRAAIGLLLDAAGLCPEEVTEIALAGSFGAHMDVGAAFDIGLLPEGFRGRVHAVGNTSLAGAVCAGREQQDTGRPERLADGCRNVELAGDPRFEKNYLRYMNFEVAP